jgi:hypothetical protein
MRLIALTLVLGGLQGPAAASFAQQPGILHAQLTTRSAATGLAPELRKIEGGSGPAWVGYSIPVEGSFQSGWNADQVVYLEGDHPWKGNRNGSRGTQSVPQDHAILLLRIASGKIGELRAESPERQIDAGGLPFVWLTDVNPAQSIGVLRELATASDAARLRDSAVFLIALHQASEATPALVSLAAPGKDLELREKAAFWLANQRGREGFLAIQRFARDDADARFREKLTFDLTLSKDPAALDELIRMAHTDASPQVRKQAQFWMATRGGAKVAGDLRGATANDPDAQVRKSAVFALSRLPGDEAATQLIAVAGSSRDSEVRKQAIFWLGQSDDPRALDYLTKLLQSESPR